MSVKTGSFARGGITLLGKDMPRSLIFLLLLFSVVTLRANTVTDTPSSYSVEFGDNALPAGAKILSLSLEVTTSLDILIRGIPPGWMFGMRAYDGNMKIVYFTRSSWVDQKGENLPLIELNGKIWIRADFDKDEHPICPPVTAYAEVIPVGGEKLARRIAISSSTLRLKYIP